MRAQRTQHGDRAERISDISRQGQLPTFSTPRTHVEDAVCAAQIGGDAVLHGPGHAAGSTGKVPPGTLAIRALENNLVEALLGEAALLRGGVREAAHVADAEHHRALMVGRDEQLNINVRAGHQRRCKRTRRKGCAMQGEGRLAHTFPFRSEPPYIAIFNVCAQTQLYYKYLASIQHIKTRNVRLLSDRPLRDGDEETALIVRKKVASTVTIFPLVTPHSSTYKQTRGSTSKTGTQHVFASHLQPVQPYTVDLRPRSGDRCCTGRRRCRIGRSCHYHSTLALQHSQNQRLHNGAKANRAEADCIGGQPGPVSGIYHHLG